MISVRANNVSFSFGVKPVLKGVNFSIHDNDKVGLVGVNGAGKTTLFKLIIGELNCEDGHIDIPSNLKISYLEQMTILETSKTILEEVMDNFSDLIDMEKKLSDLEHHISNEKNDDTLKQLIDKHERLTNQFSFRGGYQYTSRAKGILKGLGFSEKDFTKKVSTLSGGQKTRLQLAKLLNQEPDLLLLDEPTNHLDIESIEWLEKFIKTYKKCIVLISHDRYFLDQTVNKIMEIENFGIKTYKGNYTDFLKQKDIDRQIQQNHYENQQREIAKMEAFITKQKQWNRERNIIAAESRQKAIDRMEKIDKPSNLPENISFKFNIARNSGNDVLKVTDLAMSFSDKKLFSGVSFDVTKKERIFILGENGSGKSTLLKIILGAIRPDCGKITLGTNVDIDYYAQELEGLNKDNTIYDELLYSTDGLSETDIRNVLASFLFKDEDVFKKIASLSGGEKGRVALCKIMLHKANFLLLDEPTNHLDIASKEVFEKVLKDYQGTLLIVSHDRYFIEKLATRIIEITKDGVVDVCGNYSFYKEYKAGIKPKEAVEKAKIDTASKKDYNEFKEKQRDQKKAKRQLLASESKIEELENKLSEIQIKLQDESILSDYEALQGLVASENEIKACLEQEYERWEEISSNLEQ